MSGVLGREAEAVVADGELDAARRARARTATECPLARDARLDAHCRASCAAPSRATPGSTLTASRSSGTSSVDVDRRSAARARRSRATAARRRRAARFAGCGASCCRPSSSRVVSSRLSIMRKQALAVFEHAPAEPLRVVLARAQHERLGCELNARERALELVRHGREEVLLPAAQLRVVPDRAREHRHAADQHDEEEAAFPQKRLTRRRRCRGSAHPRGRRDVGNSARLARCARRLVASGRVDIHQPTIARAIDVSRSSSRPAGQTAAGVEAVSALLGSRFASSVAHARARARGRRAPRASLRRAGRCRGACARATGTRSRTPTARARCPASSSEWKMLRVDARAAFGSSASAERGASSREPRDPEHRAQAARASL